MLSPFVLAQLSQLQLATKTAKDAMRAPVRQPVSGSVPRAVLLPGREEHSERGPYWHVERSLRSLWPAVDECSDKILVGPRSRREGANGHAELTALSRHFPQATVYLDLETCGFAGSAVFLIGVLCWRRNEWFLTQLFARDYSEEPAILWALEQLARDKAALVTFNGKSFDAPMMEDRQRLHGLTRCGARLAHCDLLHHARRRWRGHFSDCRLQTLERHLCGRLRRGDICGQDVPVAYHEYVRTGDPRRMSEVLHHNALDLITLLQLSTILLADERTAPG